MSSTILAHDRIVFEAMEIFPRHIEAAFMQLVCAVPRTARELRTLRYEARQWAEDEQPHPAILDRLHARLRDHEVA